MKKDNCEINMRYFMENFERLYKQYPECHIVIKDCKVIGSYPDW